MGRGRGTRARQQAGVGAGLMAWWRVLSQCCRSRAARPPALGPQRRPGAAPSPAAGPGSPRPWLKLCPDPRVGLRAAGHCLTDVVPFDYPCGSQKRPPPSLTGSARPPRAASGRRSSPRVASRRHSWTEAKTVPAGAPKALQPGPPPRSEQSRSHRRAPSHRPGGSRVGGRPRPGSIAKGPATRREPATHARLLPGRGTPAHPQPPRIRQVPRARRRRRTYHVEHSSPHRLPCLSLSHAAP